MQIKKLYVGVCAILSVFYYSSCSNPNSKQEATEVAYQEAVGQNFDKLKEMETSRTECEGVREQREKDLREQTIVASNSSNRKDDINEVSWLYGKWKLKTGGFTFYVYISKDKLKYLDLTNGIPNKLWDGEYTLYMNRIEFGGSPVFEVDLNRRKIYSLKGEPFVKQ